MPAAQSALPQARIKLPVPQVMTDGWKSAERTEDIRSALLKMSDYFSPSFGGQVVFRLFGPYEGIPNLLFTVIILSNCSSLP